MKMKKNLDLPFQLRLAPSRFGELPTLIPYFNSDKWKVVDKNKLQTFESYLKQAKNVGTLCVHIHVYYAEELETILRLLKESIDIIDAFVITLPINRSEIKDNIQRLGATYLGDKDIKIIMTENRGRNIKPLLIDAWNYISGFNYCLHLHTKRTKGPGSNYGLRWLESICSTLATRQQILSARYFFENNTKLGMIIPKPFKDTADHSLSWAGTGNLAYKIYSSYLEDSNQDVITELDFYSRILVFPVGGMMIFKVSALDKMQKWLKLNLGYLEISEPLPIQTSLHAIERLMVLFGEESGYSWAIFDSKNKKSKYMNSLDYKIKTNQSMLDLYTKSINSMLHEKAVITRQILELESKLRFRGKIKFFLFRLWRKIEYIIG